MVEWQSPEVLQLTGHLFAQLTIFTLGVYSYVLVLNEEDRGGYANYCI